MTPAAAASAPDTSAAQPALPHWDMTPLFPSLESSEFERAFRHAVEEIAALGRLFDRLDVSAAGAPAVSDSAAAVRAFEDATDKLNAVLEQVRTVRAYVNAFVTTDSRNAAAQARASELRGESVPLSLLVTRYTAWVGAMDVEALVQASPVAAAHAFYLRRAKTAARHLLPPAEEELAANLALAGSAAWMKLHGDLTSQIAVPFARSAGGPEQPVPMSLLRGLATDPDRDVRRRAYDAEIAAWEKAALPLAAAINGIKYETGVLSARRGWDSVVDSACFQNNIDRDTLEAMLSAARASFPGFRRYLRAKARAVSGQERLPWYDILAPMGESRRAWNWPDATVFVAEQFGSYSEKMRAFADRAFRERWVDAEPRPGKRDGAFCMGVRADESRILQNYRASYDGVSTLAHELGHGYHNLCLFGRTPLQSGTPMALAETASIFCETIVKEAAVASGDAEDRLAVLEASLQGQTQVVVDITSRFLFESRLIEARQKRELSVDELNELMLGAQRDTYGDGLDDSFLHPYMWAVKPHYYGSTFYNFPYMFGLLFGLGLYAQYREDPARFRSGYDDLLSQTGMADAATLAARFGIDIRREAFWKSSLDLIGDDIDRFEALVADRLSAAGRS